MAGAALRRWNVVVEAMRVIKDADEVRQIREAIAIAERSFGMFRAMIEPVLIVRSADPKSGQDYIRLSPELSRPFRTKTVADGTFLLKGIPPGAEVHATITAAAFGTPGISWDTTKPVTLVLDGRLGQIKGQLKPPDARRLSGPLTLSLRR